MIGILAAAAGFSLFITLVCLTVTSDPLDILKTLGWFWGVLLCIGLICWGVAQYA